MLISYPVLPAAAANADEDTYLDNIIAAHLMAAEGRYPISTIQTSNGPIHRWHGGVHLFGGGESIRAIADGTVVAFRSAQQREVYEGLGEYDTSFVLLRHETQSGENTTVVFYSLYMHLASRADLAADRYAQLPQWLRQAAAGPNVQTPANQRVWRKDVLGFVGQLYGREACHFEIFTTDAALEAFWRDSTSVTQGAGSADFFGDAHFVIPAQREFRDRHPRAAPSGPHRIDFPGNADFALELGQSGANAGKLFVTVRLHAGRRIATTYEAGPNGTFAQVGQPVVQDDYEYELYRLATALYPDCPSAGLEWLRFGRVLGPDATTRNENWQLVRYSPTAAGYIDLAPEAIAKLSDADFVHWQGWEKRTEGETANAADGLCDDERTIALCQATDDASAAKRRHLVCKAPTEWDASDLATRYAKLREAGAPLSAPDSWNRFEQHVQKMAFWPQSGFAERSVWHFHPLQFIRHYRQCGWLSSSEATQVIPRNFVAEHHGTRTIYRTSIPLGQARTRISGMARELNQTFRKFSIDTRQRQAVFLANAIVESSYMTQFYEGGRGAGANYGDWYGRGIIQITWQENYLAYFRYRGRSTGNAAQNIHWRDDVETVLFDRCDTAGFWWSRNKVNRYADASAPNQPWPIIVCENFDWRQRRCVGSTSQETRLSNPTLDTIGRLVNTGSASTTGRVNGLPERRDIFTHTQAVLTEAFYADPQGNLTLTFPSFLTPQR